MENNNKLNAVIRNRTYKAGRENSLSEITNHLESLGYKVSLANKKTSPSQGWTVSLIAENDEVDMMVNIHNPFFMTISDENGKQIEIYGEGATTLFLTKSFMTLSIEGEKINQKFLEALNKTNAGFMFTKVFYRETGEKEIMVYISTCVLSYNERDLEDAINFLESNASSYLEDLKEFIDFTTTLTGVGKINYA